MQKHVYTIAKTCAELGIKHVVICPGSRSAPLVYAFTESKSFMCYSIIDERSAGYIALGMAQQLQEPVVLICTSGTAALNFYPAIAEAYFQKIPLLVLTADRPPELLYQQDGQMIVQHNVFEKNIRASFEIPCYTHEKENLRETSNIIARAIQLTRNPVNGPVHVNIPLKEPLYPDKNTKTPEDQSGSLLLVTKRETEKSTISSIKNMKEAWKKSKRKLILIGQMSVDNDLFTALFDLGKQDEVVFLCDILSNKQSICTAPHYDFIISHETEKVLQGLQPDLLISFGGPVLSKSLKLWLKKQKPKYHFRIQPDEQEVNTYNNVTDFIKADTVEVFKELKEVKDASNGDYKKQWEHLDKKAVSAIDKYIKESKFSELHATDVLMNDLPDACNFHLANSSAIRYVSNLGKLKDSWVMNGNRGTSGIDGCSSTAVGAAIVNDRLTVLLSGDLAFLYDKNAFWNGIVPDNVRVIVLNNSGGGIFTLIDGPSSHKKQLPYFTTPHKQGIKHTALDNNLDYYFCDSLNGFRQQLKTFFEPKKRAAILEVKIDMQLNTRVFNAFKKIKINT